MISEKVVLNFFALKPGMSLLSVYINKRQFLQDASPDSSRRVNCQFCLCHLLGAKYFG